MEAAPDAWLSLLWWLVGLLAVGGVIAFGVRKAIERYSRITYKQKKQFIKRRVRLAWMWLEARGFVKRNPGLIRDYHQLYPALAALEANYQIIQKECRELLASGEELPSMKAAGGRYTKRGIHEIDWTTFMFKSGGFIEENCRQAPETARLLRKIPSLSTAFFSILGPGQRITPHWGYYKGFLRYHLGILIPSNNEKHECWLRVHDSDIAYETRDRSVIEECEKYYWHEGEGIVFDDTYLHDAMNEADESRVILFMDLLKLLPWYLHYPNRMFVWLAHSDPTVRKIGRRALAKS